MYICSKAIVESVLPEKFNLSNSLTWLVKDHLKIGQHWSNWRLLFLSLSIQTTFVAFLTFFRVRRCFGYRERSEKDDQAIQEEPVADNKEEGLSADPL